jgi:heptosyltransferase-1
MTFLKHYIRMIWHIVLRLLTQEKVETPVAEPKRILLINGAHIGDVVIATSLLPVLKSAFPNAEIGFLTGSWAQAVVRNHPDVTFTHSVDHWRMNREAPGFLAKRLHYWKTRRQALKEIRSLSYDVSISMHPWRADFLPLSWQAGIPVRAAFSGGLFAPLANVIADYPEYQRFIHEGECQLQLLKEFGIAQKHLDCRRSTLAPSSDRAMEEVGRVLGLSRIDQRSYTVIHMGAGLSIRELPIAFWHEMAARLSAHQTVLFTGKGSRESANAAQAMAGLANCVNACGKLSWDGFVAAIRYAHTFYGVDSMASHIAAAVDTKCISMYGGLNNLARFRPEGDNSTVWSNAVPCAPCHRQWGCSTMACMQGFDPNQILQIQKASAIA